MKRVLSRLMMFIGILGITGAMTLSPVFAAPDCKSTNLTTKEQTQCGVTGVGGGESGNSGNNVVKVIKNVINILLFLVSMIAVLMIVIAGFRFVTSNGDSNTVSSAKNAIIYAVIGIVIAVMAYAIVNFVLDNLT